MVTLTEGAISQNKEITKDHPEGSTGYLQVGIKGGGCSGFEYQFFFTSKDTYKPDTFTKYEQDGIVMIIDKKSDLLIDGTVIDWYSELTKQGFTFNNPNANKTCGCGSSFSV